MRIFNLFRFCIFILIIVLACASPVSAAEQRPKIALVLGGGGARGAAHAGVLKVLEANNIPIDFVVGTSMGSIVGGLYAAGYSPDEIEKLFNEIDWLDMLSDRPTEDILSFRNKKDFQRLSNLEMGFNKGKVSFPRGIIAGQKLDFMLNKLTIHTLEAQNFDQLRIPFRAVATDAVTGKLVVFDKGSLARAIRSSMSVPGAFPPVKVDGKILMDGFLVMNVPVEIAKQWGADIIITVDVGAGLMKEEQLNSLIDMTNQMINILSQKNVDTSLSLLTDKDLLINPQLDGIGPGDFVKTPEAVQKGRDAALQLVEKMKRYSVSDQEFGVFLAKQRVRNRNRPHIDAIQIAKPKRVNESLIKGRIKSKAGQDLDFDQLEKDLTNVYAIGDFETVGFDIQEKNGQNTLVVDAKEKSWGPGYMRFGLNLQSDFGSDNSYTTIFDYRRTQINRLGGEWKLVGQIGQMTGLSTEFYQPLDPQNYFFIAPQFGYLKSYQDIFDGKDRIAKYEQSEFGGGFDLGVNLKSYVEARVGLRRSVINAEPEIGGTNLPEFNNLHKAGIEARVDFDQFDDHRFPTKGIKAETRLYFSQESLGAEHAYQKADFALAKATTYKDRHTLVGILHGGLSLDEDVPFYDQFTAGGFLNLSGLSQGQLRSKNTGVVEGVYLYKLLDTQGLANKIYLGGSLEAGNVWAEKSDFGEDPIISGSVFVGLDTVLGPLYIGYGLAEEYPGRAFIYLGKTF